MAGLFDGPRFDLVVVSVTDKSLTLGNGERVSAKSKGPWMALGQGFQKLVLK